MKKDGIGGVNTKTGLVFEGQTDLATFLSSKNGYEIKIDENNYLEVFYKNNSVGYIFKKK